MIRPGPDQFRLDGRIAFISGAAGHLGQQMALALGRAGAHVILNGRSEARLVALAAKLQAESITCEVAPFDVMDLPTLRDFFVRLTRLDILINNAVTMQPKAFAATTPEDFDTAYRSAVVAGFEAVRSARPALVRAVSAGGGASVINIASMYGTVGPDIRLYNEPGQMSPPHYGAAKAALIQLTRHLASELGPGGVRVNALCPGPFPRPDVVERDPVFAARLAGRTMLRRTGTADEIAGPVLFLASPASSFVTGSVVMADGGWTAW